MLIKTSFFYSAQRVNSPPKAIVQPVFQTVNLPTTKAIIDGSGSSDDTADLKFKWEILNGLVIKWNFFRTEPNPASILPILQI
jgi:hypothetical protein